MPIESNHYLGLDGGEAAGAAVRRNRHADLLHQWPQGAREVTFEEIKSMIEQAPPPQSSSS
jgi:hypothetical protein